MPRFDQQPIGLRIRASRNKNGLSQVDLANKIGVSQPLVSLWELNKVKPDPRQINKLEMALGGITSEEESSEQSLPPIAVWLARALERADMTPHELSKGAGVSAATIYNLLYGRALNPQQRTLASLENTLAACGRSRRNFSQTCHL